MASYIVCLWESLLIPWIFPLHSGPVKIEMDTRCSPSTAASAYALLCPILWLREPGAVSPSAKKTGCLLTCLASKDVPLFPLCFLYGT